ncbi:MAG: S9 family peptidase [Cytophagales bacterium]|nr:S9 family peptidase [Cytophagales bacterium]
MKASLSRIRPFLYLLVCLPFSGFAQIQIEDFTSHWAFPYARAELKWNRDSDYYTILDPKTQKLIQKRTQDQTEIRVLADLSSQNLPQIQDYTFSRDQRKILLITQKKSIYRYSFTAKYYLYDLDSKSLEPLSSEPQSYATFSPDGEKVAYVQNNNLFYYLIKEQKTIQITTDGEKNKIINGSGDWVHEEEFELVRAFSWSPDSQYLVFHRFDETRVKEFTMLLWGTKEQLYPQHYTFKYPKAGEENAKVSLHLYHLPSQQTRPIVLPISAESYYPKVAWTKQAHILSVRCLNRLQNTLQLFHIDILKDSAILVLEERSDTYVDITFCKELFYLKDQKHFIISSERSGYKHLYLYRVNGDLVRPLTRGKWELIDMIGVNETPKKPWIYYLSTEKGYLERRLYRVNIEGKRKTLLSKEKGVVRVHMSKDGKHYIESFSSQQKPPTIRLFGSDGKKIRTLISNEAYIKTVQTYNLVEKEFFSFPASDGQKLHGYFFKPKNFSKKNKYPLLLYQYSGPGTQNVLNEWGGHPSYYWHQFLVQQGFVVAVVDTRGGGGRGVGFKKATYGQMGKLELEDLIQAGQYLRSLSFVDENKLGIWGWSYGGYMSALALMAGNEIFTHAISVAPVSSWRFYDTIYTERYMGLPQQNPEGYDNYSPLSHVEKLKGNFLLIHGTADDNVHFQHALVLQAALVQANKPFSTQYYTNETHSLAQSRTHLFYRIFKFLQEE